MRLFERWRGGTVSRGSLFFIDMKQELKPCPFCGGDAAARGVVSLHIVQCLSCMMSTPPYREDKFAAEVWNTRPEHSGERAEIDWEQRRYEIAKDFLCASETRKEALEYLEERCETAVLAANELINQLKQQSDD